MVGSSDADDLEIARLLRADPHEGIRRLLLQCGGRIRGYLRQRFPSLDESDLQDVLTDAMLAVAESYDPARGTLPAWFLLLAHQQAVKRIRAQQPRGSREVQADEHELARSDDDPLSRMIERECLEELDAVIMRFPTLERAVMQADLDAGHTVSASMLAETLDTTEASVYAARKRARRRMMRQCRWIRERLAREVQEHE